MNFNEIMSATESVLFVHGEPMSIQHIAKALEISEDAVLTGLERLIAKYDADDSGFVLIRKENLVQLSTKSQNVRYVENFVKNTFQESLSKAALEVLSVIAYRGPIARSEIESVRGVNCSMTLRNLLLRELIERKENADDSRGYLYSVTFQFLKELGLQTVSELPDYERLANDERMIAFVNAQKSIQQEEQK